MADPDRDIEQALVALKKGTQLLKYSRQGKPKFCPFRVSPDETTLIWYSHGSERNLKLSAVERLIPGQRTPVFKRYLRPEKEYLSFSLIYNNGERSLDLICKDKTESEVWITGLKALITSSGQNRNRRTRSDIPDLQDAGSEYGRPFGSNLDVASICRGRISIDLNSPCSDVAYESANMQVRTGGGDGFRISVSSIPSCSSGGSGPDDVESLGDVYMWGEVWTEGSERNGNRSPVKTDVLTPKPLESNVVLDVHRIACGAQHVVLVTRPGEVFSWGEEAGGRLGHGIEKDFGCPRLVDYLTITSIEFVACGEFHTCAVSTYGDLYTWGDGIHNAGVLGHGNDVSHWMPKRVNGPLEGLQVLSIACGTWHSALATSNGKLFTFGDGSFGVLGHGNRESVPYPKEVQLLSGLKTIKVACGVWHTAAIVENTSQSGVSISPRKLFTWGDGDKYRLGHGNKETYLLPTPVDALIDYNFHQIDCGHNITVGLTTSGHIFTMGSNSCGQLGNPQSDGVLPCLVQDLLVGMFVEEVACGASHVAVLTSGNEVYTWGKGANGRLGHGDHEDRKIPTLVEALKDKHVKNIACGSNYTASICIHKWVSGADQSVCTGCKLAFGFTRKRHNCYNCGLVHCHGCSAKKALKAQLAPTPGKPHRVCDSCYLKLKTATETGPSSSALSRKGTTASHRDGSTRLDRGETRTSRVLISPIVEPIKFHEVKSGKPGTTKSDSFSLMRASQVPSHSHLKDIASTTPISAFHSALKPVMTGTLHTQQHSVPQSQSNSRPVSPYSRRPSPPRSVTPVFSRGVIDSLKKTNELLNQEVSKLQNQMKHLKQKSEFQEEEMQKLKKKVQEADSLAAERSSKCAKAVNAMKGITEQLKEVTEKSSSEMEALKSINTEVQSLLDTLAPQEVGDNSSSPSDQEVHNNQNIQTNQTSTAKESSERQDNVVEDGENFNADRAPKEYNLSSVYNTRERGGSSSAQHEVIEQFEPGVYVTLLQHADGTKTINRVRFSKRRFNSDQAEEWLKGNRERLYRSYAAQKIYRSASAEALPPSSTSTSTATVPVPVPVPEEQNNIKNNSNGNETAAPEEQNNNNNNSNDNNETAAPEEQNNNNNDNNNNDNNETAAPDGRNEASESS